MSLDRCTTCGHVADTDEDFSFYDFDYTTENGYGGHCFMCRDDIYAVLCSNGIISNQPRIGK